MPKKKASRHQKKKGGGTAKGELPARGGSSELDDDAWIGMIGAAMDGEERQQEISRSTLYDEYKRATTRFREGMVSLVPSLGTKVHDLVVASDSLVEMKKEVSPNLLRTLRSAIRIRKRVSLLYVGGQGRDPGHEYFVRVLQYCYQSLKPLASNAKTRSTSVDAGTSRQDESDAELSNKFHALSTEEPEDGLLEEEGDTDESEADDDWEEESVERPEEPDEIYSIAELIGGSDCFLATSFLESINTLLGEVALAYSNLKVICRQQPGIKEEKPLLGFEMMKCAVVANAAVLEQRYAEQVLIAERPYLNTIFRIIAAALSEPNINYFIREMVGDDEQEKRKAATEYIGDSLSHFDDDTGEEHDQWLSQSSRFARRWHVPPQNVRHFGVLAKCSLVSHSTVAPARLNGVKCLPSTCH